jgi:spore germination protein YaaH
VIGVSFFLLTMLCAGFVVGLGGASPAAQHGAGAHHRHRAAHTHRVSGNALDQLGAAEAVQLAPATTAPVAAPADLVSQQPLAARENFAFAPYWTLPQSASFSLTGLSTLAYFSVDVNPNGTLDESGPGWNGFQSQALADLITRAHAAGERVVLTITDFAQGSLDAITSSPGAPATLSSALIPLLQSKSLDGVNIDFEGDGSRDQSGLTNLVTAVSDALRAADPHWQITMDTYASSAGDPGGFYNIPELAPAVDAFFVMDYELNLRGTPSAASPLTSGQFSSLTTMKQYTAAVPASKVILGLPFFGIDWPTDNGTMAANAAGGAADIADSQAAANGPEYWDPVTDTAWTSYQVGNQWHESYYEGAYGLYELSQLTSYFGARGVGIWALGMEGDGARLIGALDGISPGGPGGTGPQATSASPAPGAPAPTAAPAPAPAVAPAPAPAPSSGPPPGGQPGGTAPQPSGPGAPASSTTTTAPSITGVYNGKTVTLLPVDSSNVVAVVQTGTLTNFQSTNATYACLNGQSLPVYQNVDTKLVAVPGATACVKQDFELGT